MKTCKKHIQFRKDCISCLLDRIARLEHNLDGINDIASDANANIRNDHALDLEYYRERLRSLDTLPVAMPATTGNNESSSLKTTSAS